MCDSYRRWTGRELIPPKFRESDAGRYLFHAPFAVLSHDGADDPLFTYANIKAMELFEMDWTAIVGMPSRLSAEADNQGERERLLRTVREKGYIDDYSGIRISAAGRRFRINNATVWNLVDADGRHVGQAAMFGDWTFL